MEKWLVLQYLESIPVKLHSIECDKALFDGKSVSFHNRLPDGGLGNDILPGYSTIAKFQDYVYAIKVFEQ